MLNFLQQFGVQKTRVQLHGQLEIHQFNQLKRYAVKPEPKVT